MSIMPSIFSFLWKTFSITAPQALTLAFLIVLFAMYNYRSLLDNFLDQFFISFQQRYHHASHLLLVKKKELENLAQESLEQKITEETQVLTAEMEQTKLSIEKILINIEKQKKEKHTAQQREHKKNRIKEMIFFLLQKSVYEN
jgi:hypothetical protein